MRANLDQYTKEEIAEAFHKYMDYVGYEEGTTFVSSWTDKNTGVQYLQPNTDYEMSEATVNIIHAINDALLE